MRRETQGGITALVGGIFLRLTVTGELSSYVRPELRWPLAVACAILVLIGLATLFVPVADAGHGHGDGHGHGHGHGRERAGAFLLAPLFAIVLVAPSPLGAFAADRSANRIVVDDLGASWAPLPAAEDGAVPLTLSEFTGRASSSDEATVAELQGKPVRLTGFVVGDPTRTGYRLTRFIIGCCAADAFPIQVVIAGAAIPPVDSWVEVTATWDGRRTEPTPGTSIGMPVLEAIAQVPVEEPAEPYEF